MGPGARGQRIPNDGLRTLFRGVSRRRVAKFWDLSAIEAGDRANSDFGKSSHAGGQEEGDRTKVEHTC